MLKLYPCVLKKFVCITQDGAKSMMNGYPKNLIEFSNNGAKASQFR